ncbi:MAG: anhydro-N-acetylmuramic acid kinase [Proteobacteria bacterium]|nr:anhydro-N-acetylmuramic acid kinase [Pseudomonadota bacterium]
MYTALGLMSGTSFDGIDAAVIRTDGEKVELTDFHTMIPYTDAFREKLRSVMGGKNPKTPEIEKAQTELHAEAVKQLLEQHNLKPEDIDVIGFHGQTIYHNPAEGKTWQIGDGALLASLTGIDVVNDFRTNDVKNGGQGAPLVPLFHAALVHGLKKPVALLNIGGIGNITYIGDGKDEVIGFDTGPGNALIDDWMFKRAGKKYDEDGKASLAGKVQEGLITHMLQDAYFGKVPPKSLDRDNFRKRLDETRIKELTLEDGAATLSALTARAVKAGMRFLPKEPLEWYVTGGGRHNQRIMKELKSLFTGKMLPVEAIKLNGDVMEAQAFAFLAVRSLKHMPLSLPTTTGVAKPITGGVFHAASSGKSKRA